MNSFLLLYITSTLFKFQKHFWKIFFQFKKYIADPELRELLVVGGQSIKDQITVINHGIDIVVGTPGRLEALIQDGYIALNQCR